MDFLIDPQAKITFQIILALLLGALIGLEREYKRKGAGLQTYALVSLGAVLFTIISLNGFESFLGKDGINFDPSRVVSQVVLGIGFIGAGLIVYRRDRIEGLTTAAGIWVVAAIGVAVGVELYFPAILTAFLVVGILAGLGIIERRFLEPNLPPWQEE